MVTIQIQLLFALTSVKITHFAEVFIFSMTPLSDHLMAKQTVKNSYTIPLPIVKTENWLI